MKIEIHPHARHCEVFLRHLMQLTYDPDLNVAYIRLRVKRVLR
jgi:hypothetical protein